jgi:hypothetical protein
MNREQPLVKENENFWSSFEMGGTWGSVDFPLILIQLNFRGSTFFLQFINFFIVLSRFKEVDYLCI